MAVKPFFGERLDMDIDELSDDRAFLAAQVPHDFDGVFRQVVRARLEWSLHEGYSLFPETVELWNATR